MERMDISVIVVCYNEGDNIETCLESLVRQEYAGGRYEVIVIDGASTDSTLSIARGFEQRHSFIKVLVEPRRGTAVARNTGIKASGFPYIAFLDADCVASNTWLSALVTAYRDAVARDTAIAAVGGPSFISEGSKPFVEALKIALNTYPGSAGRVTGTCHPRERFVADLPSLNVMYSRKLFDQLGFFSDSLMSEGEDADFSYRILKTGRKLLYSPMPIVYHKYRPDPLSWWNNMRRYGRARASLLIKSPSMLHWQYLAPFILVLSLMALPLAFRWPVLLLPLIYFPVMLLVSIYGALNNGNWRLIPAIFCAYLLTHIGYGWGEVEGFVRGFTGKASRSGRLHNIS